MKYYYTVIRHNSRGDKEIQERVIEERNEQDAIDRWSVDDYDDINQVWTVQEYKDDHGYAAWGSARRGGDLCNDSGIIKMAYEK